jgi:RNA polymerase sigma-70 factor (ECF subfamily)
MSPWLRNLLDLLGLVDETLLKAWQAGERLRSLDEGERVAWLRTVLANRIKDEIAKLHAECRDVRRNRSLETARNESSARTEAVLAAPQSSPSAAADRHEQERRLAEAVEQLPEAQREALLM